MNDVFREVVRQLPNEHKQNPEALIWAAQEATKLAREEIKQLQGPPTPVVQSTPPKVFSESSGNMVQPTPGVVTLQDGFKAHLKHQKVV